MNCVYIIFTYVDQLQSQTNIYLIFWCQVLSQCIFPRATSQVTASQLATSQLCNFPSGNFLKVRLGPLRRCRLQKGPSAVARIGQGAERSGQNRLGAECCGQNILGKLPLGKLHIWEVAALENAFGKLPKIKIKS